MATGTRTITAANGREATCISIRPTGRNILIPVTGEDGRHGLIRRELYVSDDGRMFVMNDGAFDEVRQTAFGYAFVGTRFLDGEWHYEGTALVPGPRPWVPEPIRVDHRLMDGFDASKTDASEDWLSL